MDDIKLVCFCDRKLADENRFVKYIGGYNKICYVPRSIGFTAFKRKIRELMNLRLNGIEFNIKCAIRLDDVTEIASDVDDDISLRSIMDSSKFITAYVIKQLPAGTTSLPDQRKKERPFSDKLMSYLETSNDNHGTDLGGDYNLVNEQQENHKSLCTSPLHKKFRLSHSDANARPEEENSMAGEFLFDVDKYLNGEYYDYRNFDTWNEFERKFCVDVDVHSENSDWSLAGSCQDSGLSDSGYVQDCDVEKGFDISDQTYCEIPGWLDNTLDDMLDQAYLEFNVRSLQGLDNNCEFFAGQEFLEIDALRNSQELEDICEFYVGQVFQDIYALKNSLSDLAVKTRREYKQVKSRHMFRVKCKDALCNWHLHAMKLPNSSYKVIQYEKLHKCLSDHSFGSRDHPQASTRWIASKLQSSIIENPDMEPKNIVKVMKQRFGIQISYNKAVKAKDKILKVIHKRYAVSYSILPRLVEELEQNGSVAKLGFNSDRCTFQYLFWAFSACICALRANLRPVLFVETKRIAIGVLMYARGVDGNGFDGQPIHVAFAVFATEDDMAWEIFMGCLREYILPPRPEKDTLLSSECPFTIVTENKRTATRAVKKVLPCAHHFFSTTNLKLTLSTKFTHHKLHSSLSNACESYSPEKCEESLRAIDLLHKETYDWLVRAGSSSWSYAFSNIHCKIVIEEDKYITKAFEVLTIVEVVECTRNMVAGYFSERQSVGAKMTTVLTPHVMDYINSSKVSPLLYKVESNNGESYQLTGEGFEPHVVSLDRRSCTCYRFQGRDYPCEHALMVIEHENLDKVKYFALWFTADSYRGTYAGSFPSPMPCILNGQPAESDVLCLPPKEKKRVGRPRKEKLHSQGSGSTSETGEELARKHRPKS